MVDVRELEELQLDALCEVANIGAGHAATALSQMTGNPIMVEVPRLHVMPVKQVAELLAGPDAVMASVIMQMHGDLTGQTLLVLHRDAALRLSEILLGREFGSAEIFGELEQSAIMEVGNILGSTYMNALAEFLGMTLLPSVPNLVIDESAAVVNIACAAASELPEAVFSIETQFMVTPETNRVGALFLLLPDADALTRILERIRLA